MVGRRFEAERAADQSHAADAYGVYESQRADLRQRAQRRASMGHHRRGSGRRSTLGTTTRRNGSSASSGLRPSLGGPGARSVRCDSLEAVEKPWEGWDLRFNINETKRSGDVVVRLEDAVVERGDFTLGPFTLDLAWAERMPLSVPTGRERRRWSKLCSDASRSPGGRDASVRASWWANSARTGASSATAPISPMPSWRRPDSPATRRGRSWPSSAWARMRSTRPASSLSPGERTRAELASFAALGVNFLVLDEPTNHLDLPAIEQLESALHQYGGTLLLVSHDRRLLETVTTTRRVGLPAPDQVLRGLREDL